MNYVFTWPVGRAANAETGRPAPVGPVAAYALATTLAGAAVGTAVASLAVALREAGTAAAVALFAAAVALGVVAVASEWRGTVRPLPQRHAQVPRRWLRWPSRTRTAAAFGLMIGTGFLTFLEHAAVYAVLALLLLAPTPATGLLIGAGYGSGRGAVLGVTWLLDRRGRRLGWERLLEHKTRVHRVVAAVAAATLVPLLVLGASF